ncbi:MAG: hypothetical protein BAA02_07810 [Paenibacillaceae bacterium ZCTH02-B3]|mgnify:FL=1|nr:MAG: hypothetical protein BAA02_07810 [Paenibacillaceae bacterium ZCTH02-B3]
MNRENDREMPADYRQYRLTRTQRIAFALAGCNAVFAAAWFVYGHPLAGLLLSPAGLLAPRLAAGALLKRRRERLRREFKDMLQALSALLSAGRSVENAFQALESELKLMMAHSRSDLLREIRIIAARQRNGAPLEEALRDFAVRAGMEEVDRLAEALAVCKKTGGDLVDVVRRTSVWIGEKMEVEMEVAVVTAQKRFEARVMMAMPFVFVGLLQWIAPDYMAYLRHGPGLVVMTVCLLLLAACGLWIKRIMEILP